MGYGTTGLAACFQCGDLLGVLFLSPGVLFCLLEAQSVFCSDFAIFDGLGSRFFRFLGFVDFGLFFQSV